MGYREIIDSIKKKNFEPVYFLAGDEPWIIDEITSLLEKQVLADSEKAFNQSTFYGKDSDVLTVISTARRFPMMAEHQLVIVREAQGLKNLDRMVSYFQNPLKSTILVIAYKNGKPDGRTDFLKKVKKFTHYFESNELRDHEIINWIVEYVASTGIIIEPRAAALLAEYLGNDLSRLSHEIQKLCVGLKQGSHISSSMIESNTGISREYTVFELTNALTRKHTAQAGKIIYHMTSNLRENPPVLIVGTLISFFSKVLLVQSHKNESINSIAARAGISPFFVKDYLLAAVNYSLPRLVVIFRNLKLADLHLKGVDVSPEINHGDILKELVYLISHYS